MEKATPIEIVEKRLQSAQDKLLSATLDLSEVAEILFSLKRELEAARAETQPTTVSL